MELSLTDVMVSVRDSKDPEGSSFAVSPGAWLAFLGSVPNGPDPAQ
ncbi:DUF397 domain-containing protein [Lentzea sp. NPDC051208]